MKLRITAVMLFGFLTFTSWAQQTGSISGTVDANNEPLPGVTISATSNVLPRPRFTVSNGLGQYRLNLLPPGDYELSFTMSGMGTVKRNVRVLLQQNTVVDITMIPGSEETLIVTADIPLIDTSSAEIKNAIDRDVFEKIPVGQEYRDIVKLIPGVQYSEDQTRGPSAGGSGQDNVYLFDGVNVTLPLFGTLATDPSSHDIEQIAIVKGGAKATGFNRSGGFTINTISKSGSNRLKGELSFQLQDSSLTEKEDTSSSFVSDEDKTWAIASVGGPIIRERLFFYTSYYGPTVKRDNQANLYGDVPDFESDRDEIFFKLTFSPLNNFTLNASYRDSDRQVTADGVGGEATAGTATTGSDIGLEILIVEGSWIVNQNGAFSFKYTDFANKNLSRPDNFFGSFASITNGSLDLNNLDQLGRFFVPTLRADDPTYNGLATQLIDRYGYVENGQRVGGGVVGGAELLNDQDFFRESFEIGYDFLVNIGRVSHDLHVGFQSYEDVEEFQRSSNGWGDISYIGGSDDENPERFFSARFRQGTLNQALGNAVGLVHSEFKSQNFEVNDTITLDKWAFNVGLLVSNDELIGQGLESDPSTPSGFRVNPESQYTMYEVPWEDQLQPRLGAVWNFHDSDTVYANWSRYNPAASSLPRAASWARNLIARQIDAFFDENGNFLEATQVQSSSGKFFQPNMDPRTTQEYITGISKNFTQSFTAKAHYRFRYANHFWEDTNNDARARFGNTDEIRAQPDYIPELNDFRFGEDGIGGSSYVIAQLDGAVSRYHEVSLDGEWRGEKTYLKGSYVWSHYYGNVDQDNTTVENDQNIFIGSSNLADGPGRQLWDNKYGNLRGDRRHQVKLYGYYQFRWNASLGAFTVFQSGQPWEAWDRFAYEDLIGSSTSDTIRFAEAAGTRSSGSHYQIDINYTQRFLFSDRYRFEGRIDIFNITDNQTGYNIEPRVNSSGFGDPRSFFDPRRIQLLVKFGF